MNPDGFWGALGCPAASRAFALSLQDALGRAAPALGVGTRRVTGAAAPTGGARLSEDLGRPGAAKSAGPAPEAACLAGRRGPGGAQGWFWPQGVGLREVLGGRGNCLDALKGGGSSDLPWPSSLGLSGAGVAPQVLGPEGTLARPSVTEALRPGSPADWGVGLGGC